MVGGLAGMVADLGITASLRLIWRLAFLA